MVGDRGPVASRDERRHGLKVRICFWSDGFINVELFFSQAFVATTHELKSQRYEEQFRVGAAGSLENLDSELRVAPEQGSCGKHRVLLGRILRVNLGFGAVGIVVMDVAPTTNFQAELTMVGAFGVNSVEARQMALFAIVTYGSFPLGGIWDGD